MSVLAFEIFQGVILFLVACICLITPTLTRRDIFFGVTVTPDARNTPAGRRILQRYRLGIAGAAIIMLAAYALLVALAYGGQDQRIATVSIGLLVILLAFLLVAEGCYLLAYRASRALRAPADEQQTIVTAELRPRRYGDYVPWIWELLPLAIIAGTSIALATSYSSAPVIIATHFDSAGQANGFAPKTIGSYFFIVWTQLALEIVLTGLSVLTVGSKAQVSEAQTRFRRIWIRYLFVIKIIVLAMLGVVGVATAQAASSKTLTASWLIYMPIVVSVAVVIAAVALALRTGQGGARLGSATETATDRLDDRYWLAGAIYVNRTDPSIFVEKRFGVGWTINFGNPRAIAVMVGILVVVIAPSVLVALSRGR